MQLLERINATSVFHKPLRNNLPSQLCPPQTNRPFFPRFKFLFLCLTERDPVAGIAFREESQLGSQVIKSLDVSLPLRRSCIVG